MAVSVTVQPGGLMSSAGLIGVLDQASRLASAAARADLVERLGGARARVAARGMRVVVIGPDGHGATSLVSVLGRAPASERPVGASFVEAPARVGANQAWVPQAGSAEVVLFVCQGAQEYGPGELDMLAHLCAQGVTTVGVLTKIDLYPGWAQVQQANRRRLQGAGLEVALLPVSAGMCDTGWRRGDQSLVVSSGVPQLLEFLRDRVDTAVDPALRDVVLGEVRSVAEQLGAMWNSELDGLRGATDSPRQRQQRAVAGLERCQQLSADWQLSLGDGFTELVSQVDFDLRERLREVMEDAEAEISKANPTPSWERFAGSVRAKVDNSVRANFVLATQRSRRLGEQVGAALTGNRDGSPCTVAVPEIRFKDPRTALGRLKAMQPPEPRGGFARVVNSVRGSYGGILMVGVLTSLAGLSLISVWSVAAGLALGVFTFWEDRKNGDERGKAEAKVAVAKLMDAVNFRVGEELRSQLRVVHRTLRDHFTVLNDQRLRAASDAVRAALDAAQLGEAQREDRLGELQNHLAELRQLRVHSTISTR